MARFEFRLQPLLGVKEQIEEQKEIEYGQALRRLDEERKKKERLIAQRDETIEEFRRALEETLINPPDTKRFNNIIERIKQRIWEQEKRIEAAEAYAETKRVELVEAMKERKMLESIREHRLDEFKQEEKLAEQKQTDELVSYKYHDRVRIPEGVS